MKILVDENMSYSHKLFSRTGDLVVTIPGRLISPETLDEVDALIVRSVTQVNEDLLGNTKVKFVGTATSGVDHIDKDFLTKRGIGFSSAPGCNAIAVVEYVFSSLLMLAERDGFQLNNRTVGIVGVGHVGSRLQKRLEAFGIKTLLCDPIRANYDNEESFLSLKDLVMQSDILTLHTPLIIEGCYQTMHMVDEALLYSLKPNAILINTCRGPVIDNIALLQVLQKRNDLSVVLDVWETEPDLSTELLKRIDIGTPHIAGYTIEGKARGTTQIFEAWTHFTGHAQKVSLETLLPPSKFRCITLHGSLNQSILRSLVHLVYDVRNDDALLRRVKNCSKEFDLLRKHYQERREWSSLYVKCDNIDVASLLQNLGFNATYQPT